LETVTAETDAKHTVDAVYLDMAKAFDEVPQLTTDTQTKSAWN